MSVGEAPALVGPGSELQLTIDGGARPRHEVVAEGGPEPSSSSAAAAVIAVELVDAADTELGLEVGEEAAALEPFVPHARAGVRDENLFVAGQRLAARAASPATRRQYASIYGPSATGCAKSSTGHPPPPT